MKIYMHVVNYTFALIALVKKKLNDTVAPQNDETIRRYATCGYSNPVTPYLSLGDTQQ